MMWKRFNLALLSAVLLVPAPTGAVLKGTRAATTTEEIQQQQQQQQQQDRGLAHHRRKPKHHVEIVQAFAAEEVHYPGEDDDGHYYDDGYYGDDAYYGDDDYAHVATGHYHDDDVATEHYHDDDVAIEHYHGHIHKVDSDVEYYKDHPLEYLPPDVIAQPFSNCLPESWHNKNRNHGKHGMNHKHGKHKHKDGKDHHPHKHHHKKGGAKRYQAGSKSKSKGKGATYAYASSKSSKSKGKGGYYRQRDLRFNRRNHQGGRTRRGHGGMMVKPRQAEPETEIPKTEPIPYITHAEYLAQEAAEDSEEKDYDGAATEEYDDDVGHHHHGDSADQHLPICPNETPVRKTFGPIPTISPLEDGNATAPSVAPPGGEGDGTGDGSGAGDGCGAPVDTPAGTERVLVASNLQYGFFAEDVPTPREATQEEIDGVMARTSEWYTTQLMAIYPTLQSFQAVYIPPQVFDATATEPEFPVTLNFDANGFFTEGGANPTTPELFAAMEGLNYPDYIMMAAWTPDMSGGQFDSTERVAYNARAGTEAGQLPGC